MIADKIQLHIKTVETNSKDVNQGSFVGVWSDDQKKKIIRNLRGHFPSEFIAVTWELVHACNETMNASGVLVCVSLDNYNDLEDAAYSRAVYFAPQNIQNHYELEGALLGHEVANTCSGMRTCLYIRFH